MALGKSRHSFKNLEQAKCSVPRKRGPSRILVLNKQGLPILHYDVNEGEIRRVGERECAMGAELAREVYRLLRSYRDEEPFRVAVFYPDEVMTIERNDPFILLITWPHSAINMIGSNEAFVRRLEVALREELT